MFLAAQAVVAVYAMASAGLTDDDAIRVIVAGPVLSPQSPPIALALVVVAWLAIILAAARVARERRDT